MIMESLLNWLRDWQLGESAWTMIVAAEMFCVDHKVLVGLISMTLLLVSFVFLCLKRGRASRDLAEGGERRGEVIRQQNYMDLFLI